MLGREHGPKASSLILEIGKSAAIELFEFIGQESSFNVSRSNVVPIKPPAKTGTEGTEFKIEENTDSIESAIQLKDIISNFQKTSGLIVIIPEAARNPKNENCAKAIIFIAFNDILTKNAIVAPKRNPRIPLSP